MTWPYRPGVYPGSAQGARSGGYLPREWLAALSKEEPGGASASRASPGGRVLVYSTCQGLFLEARACSEESQGRASEERGILSRVYTVRTPVPPSVGVLYLFGQRSRGGFEPRPHNVRR